MKRIKLFIAGAAVMATMVVGAAAPAMAMDAEHASGGHVGAPKGIVHTAAFDRGFDRAVFTTDVAPLPPIAPVVDLAPLPPLPAIDNGIIG